MMLELPANWTADRVREWLLTLTSGGVSDLPLPSDVSVPVAVNMMFRQTSAERRERLKTGVVLAIQEWQYTAHRYSALEQLTKIAALVRATQAIPRIATHIKVECALRRPDPDCRAALASATACLTGFAPAVDLDLWLSIVFNDPDVEPALAGLLFVGLCKTDPRMMANHVTRFLELRASVPGAFAHLGHALVDAVPPEILVSEIEKMAPSARAAIGELVRPAGHPDLIDVLGESGLEIQVRGKPATKVALNISNVEILGELYNKLAPTFTDPNTGLLEWIHE
jgi:hypothetical protein